MIKNHIHHYFQILFMRFLYQCTEIFITSKPSVNLIIVCNGISMIGTAFHIIFLSRIQPDCCHSQISNIIQMTRYTLNITTMTCKRISTVYLLFTHTVYHVIFKITVGKTIGHNQVKNIFRSKTFYIFSSPHTRFQLVWNLQFLFSVFQQDLKSLCLCFR